VVDAARRLRGLLTERDVRFVSAAARVADRMTPRARLVVHEGPIDIDAAERLLVERKVKKLPLVDAQNRLLGLITARDIMKHRR
jgi:IMP dehydrogenase